MIWEEENSNFREDTNKSFSLFNFSLSDPRLEKMQSDFAKLLLLSLVVTVTFKFLIIYTDYIIFLCILQNDI